MFGTALEPFARGAYRAGLRAFPILYPAERRRFFKDDQMTVAVARAELRPHSGFIDAGANAGVILRSLVKCAPQGHQFAFEPIPYLAQTLRRKYPSVQVHQLALSDFEGDAEFRFVRSRPALSSLRMSGDVEIASDDQLIQVKVRRLDDVISADIPIHFLKLDVEGAEAAMLRGAERTLRVHRPVVVFESGATRLEDVLAALRPAQMRVASLDDDAARSSPNEADLLRLAEQRGDYMFVARPAD